MTSERDAMKKKLEEMTRDNLRLREMVSATIPHKKNLKIENLFNHRSANSIDHSHHALIPTKAKKIKDVSIFSPTQINPSKHILKFPLKNVN
jgi:hypothetical protein